MLSPCIVILLFKIRCIDDHANLSQHREHIIVPLSTTCRKAHLFATIAVALFIVLFFLIIKLNYQVGRMLNLADTM